MDYNRVILGICGSIAAYRAAELVGLLRNAGHQVAVVMTQAATRFITPLTLQALSGKAVRCDLFDPQAEAAMGHIELARWADAIVVAPASANLMARIAHGHADDLLSTLILASDAPLWLAPAMNSRMWQKEATRANLSILRQRGVRVIGPASGRLACGEEGEGRMAEPAAILDALCRRETPLAGVELLITAGPTREAIDPVRFLSNRSSGRMGYAVAEAAQRAGARVTLVSGPVAIAPPVGVERVMVESALEMEKAVMERVAQSQIVIATAAVADYRPAAVAEEKIKRGGEPPRIDLVANPDIIAKVAALPSPPFTVGFAAETSRVEEHARDKLQRKRLNLVAANLVGVVGSGFESEYNALQLVWRGGTLSLPLSAKGPLAEALISNIIDHYRDWLTAGKPPVDGEKSA